MRAIHLLCLVAVQALVTLIPLSVHADAAGSYAYYYGSHQRFETLGEAVVDAQSKPGVWQYLTLSSDQPTLDVNTGRYKWRLSVPEQKELVQLPTKYFEANWINCAGVCEGQDALVAYLEQYYENASWGCIAVAPTFEGNWSSYTWHRGGNGFQSSAYQKWRGVTIRYGTQQEHSSLGCYGPINYVTFDVIKYLPFDCPAYYIPKVSADLQSAHCQASLSVDVFGPIQTFCDDSTARSGNPCDVLTGNKSEAEADYTSATITFTRTYNSAQSAEARNAWRGWQHNFERKLGLPPVS